MLYLTIWLIDGNLRLSSKNNPQQPPTFEFTSLIKYHTVYFDTEESLNIFGELFTMFVVTEQKEKQEEAMNRIFGTLEIVPLVGHNIGLS